MPSTARSAGQVARQVIVQSTPDGSLAVHEQDPAVVNERLEARRRRVLDEAERTAPTGWWP